MGTKITKMEESELKVMYLYNTGGYEDCVKLIDYVQNELGKRGVGICYSGLQVYVTSKEDYSDALNKGDFIKFMERVQRDYPEFVLTSYFKDEISDFNFAKKLYSK